MRAVERRVGGAGRAAAVLPPPPHREVAISGNGLPPPSPLAPPPSPAASPLTDPVVLGAVGVLLLAALVGARVAFVLLRADEKPRRRGHRRVAADEVDESDESDDDSPPPPRAPAPKPRPKRKPKKQLTLATGMD